MHVLAALLTLAGLAACKGQAPEQANSDLAETPAAVTYQWVAGTDRAGFWRMANG